MMRTAIVLILCGFLHAANASTLGTTDCSAYNVYSSVTVSSVVYPSCKSEGTDYTMCCGSTGYSTTEQPNSNAKCASRPTSNSTSGSSSYQCPTGYQLLCKEVNQTTGSSTGVTVSCSSCEGGCYSYSSLGSICSTKVRIKIISR